MERINELIARLADTENPLNDAELAELEALLVQTANEVDPASATAEDIATLQAMGEHAVAVRAEIATRAETAASRAAEAEAALAAIRGEQAEATETEPETVEPAEVVAETEVAEEVEVVEETREPVAAAARPAPLHLAARRVPARNQPRPAEMPSMVITAAGDVPNFSAGSPMPDLNAVGRAFFDKAQVLQRGGGGGKAGIATFHRRLEPDAIVASAAQDAATNGRMVTRAIDGQVRALTAAGGFCAPAEPMYSFQDISVQDRPIRSLLTRVNSTRGRVSWVTPATIADTNSGITVHTNAADVQGSTKACVTIDCGGTQTATVDGIALCVKVGNFDRISFPEHFTDFFGKAMSELARVAERNLLDTIVAGSVAITDGSLFGAAVEILNSLGRLAARERNVHRMSPNATVAVIAPAWVLQVMRDDLSRQIAGDNALAVADAVIENYFAASHLVVTWALESSTTSGLDFAEQAAGALGGWPATAEFQVFHPGAWFLLEMPELNLGTAVRDSTLNSTNDVEAWLELFETCGMNGLWSFSLTQDICIDGNRNSGNPYDCADVTRGS